METYETLQEKARVLYGAITGQIACYVQKCSDDEWRISDVNASIRGYVSLGRQEFEPYGSGDVQRLPGTCRLATLRQSFPHCQTGAIAIQATVLVSAQS